MPAAPRRPHPSRLPRPARYRFALGVLALAATGLLVAAQDPPEPTRAGAIKLPDGTIVFYSKTPDDPNPPVDGVVLTPQEYKALVEQSEQLKRLKSGPKAQAPSTCQIRGRVEARGVRTVAVLTLTYAVRTTQPRTTVALGGQRAFPVAARLDDEKLPPVLAFGEEGLTTQIERPGDHTVTLDLEAPVAPRGTGREIGFELGLPRAAITTLAVDPPKGIGRVTVSVRTAADRPGELSQTTGDPAAVAGRPEKPVPLGPAESLAVSWEAPASQAAGVDAAATAESEVAVHVDENQVETTAKIRLRGSAREWSLVLPAGADVAAARVAPATPRDPQAVPGEPPFAAPIASPTLIRPTDPAKNVWTFRPPEGPGPDWELTVTVRQTRPKESKSPEHHGIGPFAVPTAVRQTGTVKIFAPPTVLLRDFKTASNVRRSDLPPVEDGLVAVFRFATGPVSGRPPAAPLVTFEARQAAGFVRIQPTYELTRFDSGWRLRLTARVSPVRKDVDQVDLEVPPGWEGVEAGPADLVDEVRVLDHPGPNRKLAVGLLASQKAAFDVTVTAVFPFPEGTRDLSLPVPRFPDATEHNSRVTAIVADPYEVRGTAVGAGPVGVPTDLTPSPTAISGSRAMTRVAGQLDRGVARVDLVWQLYRPELMADLRAEVGLQDRQAVITQSIRFRAAEAELRPIRLKGPPGIGGLRASPPLEPVGPGDWLVRPPEDAKEFTLSMSYALALPPRRPGQEGPGQFQVGLLWPDPATRVESLVRVWGTGSARRLLRFEGPWRELPPEPIAERDVLPWLTLAGTGPSLPLTLDLTEAAEGAVAGVTVDRSLIQAWVSEDGAVAIRGRFVVTRWVSSGIDLEIPPGVTPVVLIEDRKVEPTPVAGGSEGYTRLRIPIPAGPTGRPSLRVDVRYPTQPARSMRGYLLQANLSPPRLPGAVSHTPPRWQIVHPPGSVPVSLDRALAPESRWGWRHSLFAPIAGATTDELEQWIRNGIEPNPGSNDRVEVVGVSGDALTTRQHVHGSIRLYLIPRVWWVTGASLLALALGYGLSRLRPGLLGPGLAVVGIGASVAGIVWPQPTAQVAAAIQPGLLLLVAGLGAQALVRWYYRRRVTHLPGFTRGRYESTAVSVTGSSPSGPRSSQNGPALPREEMGSQPPLPAGS